MMSASKRLLASPGLQVALRSIHTSSSAADKTSFFSTFFERKVEAQHTSHSTSLSKKENVIDLVTHVVKPDATDKYLIAQKNLSEAIAEQGKKMEVEALGNFVVIIGNQDQYVHIWRYNGGYKSAQALLDLMSNNADFQALKKDIGSCLKGRKNQYLLPFSFWPEVDLRNGKNIYELRSYHLKAGTMVEWGNFWAQAIRLRDHKHTEAYLGMFSQVGELYNVKHVWCYSDLNERKAAREKVWQAQQDQWSEIVANTVPLIRRMTSRIMVPLDFSVTK